MNAFKTSQKQTQRLRISMKLMTSLLRLSNKDLDTYLQEASKNNPYLELKTAKKSFGQSSIFTTSNAEGRAIEQKSLFEKLKDQIIPPLFPTIRSQEIALAIIENIDEHGFFEGESETLAETLGVSGAEFERIRQRFAYLDPSGVGAKNIQESYLFQIQNLDVDEDVASLLRTMIEDLKNINSYGKEPLFHEALRIFKKLNATPAFPNENETDSIYPDLVFEFEEEDVKIKMPSNAYPDLHLKKAETSNDVLKEKFKEAKHLIDLLELRKNTLYKIGSYIALKQRDFFLGGELLPMGMQEIAENIGVSQSTISRAVSEKYVATQRGVFALKKLFCKSLHGDITKGQISAFIEEMIRGENKERPLSDEELCEFVKQEFSIELSRRSVTKYRESLNIMTSRERKRYYLNSKY